MGAYILRRILATIPVLAVVGIFVFSIVHLTPGDPAVILAGGKYATDEQIQAIRERLGFDRPMVVQLASWFGDVLQGDLGESLYSRNKTVVSMIRERMMPSISLAVLTQIWAVLFGLPMGVIAAWKPNTWIDRSVMIFSTLGFSVPLFFLGFVLMIVFAVKLGWLPAAGYAKPHEDLSQFFRMMVLPVIATGLVDMSLIARMARATVRETLNEDYIRTARAKGLVESRVLLRHALRNALLPIITVIGAGFALLLGGVVVTERVFAIPGLGRLMVDAILFRDFPLIQGLILVVALVIAIGNLLVDVTYAYLDPRIRF